MEEADEHRKALKRDVRELARDARALHKAAPVHSQPVGRQRGCEGKRMRGRFVLCPSSPFKKKIATYHEHDM